jgi:hypothetical protein
MMGENIAGVRDELELQFQLIPDTSRQQFE